MFQDKSLECEMNENLCYNNIPQQVNEVSTAEYTPVNDTLVIKTGVTTAVSKSTFLKVIAVATFLNFFLLLVAIVTFAALQAKTDEGINIIATLSHYYSPQVANQYIFVYVAFNDAVQAKIDKGIATLSHYAPQVISIFVYVHM